MQDFIYNGCVMAVEAVGSGLPEVLLPNATVTADPEHAYVKRLVARRVLVKQEKIGCQPTSITIDNQTPLPVGASFVLTYAVNDEPPITHMGTIQPFAPTPALAFVTFVREYEFIDKVTNQSTYIFAGEGGGNCIITSPNYIFQNKEPTISFSGLAVDENNLYFTGSANNITFYPTTDLLDSQDLYHFIAGENPPPSLTIHSCAVFQKMGI